MHELNVAVCFSFVTSHVRKSIEQRVGNEADVSASREATGRGRMDQTLGLAAAVPVWGGKQRTQPAGCVQCSQQQGLVIVVAVRTRGKSTRQKKLVERERMAVPSAGCPRGAR
jgi:hypothetical protein